MANREAAGTLGAAGAPREEFIAAMGAAATGVTVVATDGVGGRAAQTVSAMCSVSADPPTLLVCMNRRSPLCAALTANGYFTVNVLSAEQAHVSDTFAGRPRDGRPYDFACATWRVDDCGSPVLEGAVASFCCRLAGTVEAATHLIFLGRVLRCAVSPGEPLVYQSRTYGRHRPLGR